MNYDPEFYGFAPRHWQVFMAFARFHGYVICVRAGKRSAVPWIELGFPAKPLALKCKVDRAIGLLVARTHADREDARQAGFPVLDRVPGNASEFVARLGAEVAMGGERFNRMVDRWAQSDLVIDPDCGLPITSDYDLAAIIDAGVPDYYLTYGSMAGEGNRTNLWVDNVVSQLNRLFGSRRIMHGAQAQYSGAPAHGDDDVILAFHPNGTVTSHGGVTALQSDTELHKLVRSYHPGMAVQFYH
jgi:hypothetical protein